jgi:hypothetical protein
MREDNSSNQHFKRKCDKRCNRLVSVQLLLMETSTPILL